MGIGLCVPHMVENFSRGHDPEVEGDNITVVATVGKKQNAMENERSNTHFWTDEQTLINTLFNLRFLQLVLGPPMKELG